MSAIPKYLGLGLPVLVFVVFGFTPIALLAAELTSKQSEALFQQLKKDPQFKAADKELSAAYSKLRGTLDADAQAQLRDEQRNWLKSRDQALMAEMPERRSNMAARLTVDRTKELEGGGRIPATASLPTKENGGALPSGLVPAGVVGGILTPKQTDACFEEVMKDQRVSVADKQMAAAYSRSRDKLNAEGQIKLRDEQREWLKFRSNHVAMAIPEQRAALAAQITKDRESHLLLNLGESLSSNQARTSSAVTSQITKPISEAELEVEWKSYLNLLHLHLGRQFQLFSTRYPDHRSQVELLKKRFESIQGTRSSQYSQHLALVHDLSCWQKLTKAVVDAAKVPPIVLRQIRGEVTTTPPVTMEGIDSAMFLDSNRLATAYGNLLCVWDLQTQKPVWTAIFPENIECFSSTNETGQFLVAGEGSGQVREKRIYSVPVDGFGFAKCLITYTQVKAASNVQKIATDGRGKLLLAIGYHQGGASLEDLALEPVPEKLKSRFIPYQSSDSPTGKKTTAFVFVPTSGSVRLLASALDLPDGDWGMDDGPWQSKSSPLAAFSKGFQAASEALIARFPNWSESRFRELGVKPDDVIRASSSSGLHLLERQISVKSNAAPNDRAVLLLNERASIVSESSWLLGSKSGSLIENVSIGNTGWVSAFSVSSGSVDSNNPVKRLSINWSELTLRTSSTSDVGRKQAVYSSLGLDSNDALGADGHSQNLPRALDLGEELPAYVAVLKDAPKSNQQIVEKYKLEQGRFKLLGRVSAGDSSTTGSGFFCARKGECVVYVGRYRDFQGLQVWDKMGRVIYRVEVEANGADASGDAIELNPDEFALAYTGGLLVMKSDASGRWSHQSFPEIRKIGALSYNREAKVLGMSSGNRTLLYDWDGEAFNLKATVLYNGEHFPSVLLPNQMYACPGGFSRDLAFVRGVDVFPFEQFDLQLNRPDIVLSQLNAPKEAIDVARRLREKRLARLGVKEEMLKPNFHIPEIQFTAQVPTSTPTDQIELNVKARDSLYSLERFKVYLNNVPINGRDGESLVGQNLQSLERTVPVKLTDGRNKIQISVLNNAGAESLYATAEVYCTAKRQSPTLYVVSMGVSEYANKEWNLKYAAKDACDIAERLQKRAPGSTGEVKTLLLTDKDVQKQSLSKIRGFLSQANVDDSVVMFAAGHGVLDEKYDYFFGSSDIDFKNPSEKGISFDSFDDLLAEIPCLKKAFLVDTCHAGELDADEKKALAAAQIGSGALLAGGNKIAVRSVGTRGMNVKPIEGARGVGEWHERLQGMFVDLRRGSGSTVLTSSAGAEYALESSEQKNGLFTYAVLEALDGNEGSDINKDGRIQMSELGEYVKKRVALLTNSKQSPNTRRVNIEGDFPISGITPYTGRISNSTPSDTPSNSTNSKSQPATTSPSPVEKSFFGRLFGR